MEETAKFCYVKIGDTENPLTVMVNIECEVNLVEQFARKKLLEQIDMKIAHAVKAKTLIPPKPAVSTLIEGEEGETETDAPPTEGEGEPAEPEVDQVAVLEQLKANLVNIDAKLTDEACSAECPRAPEDRLTARAIYSLAVFQKADPEVEGSEDSIIPLLISSAA